MADLLRSYRDTQRRLDPHLDRYIQIMEADPVYDDAAIDGGAGGAVQETTQVGWSLGQLQHLGTFQ